MEGFILAAGLGTRLQPLTNDRPKALVEVNGITLLEMAIHKLESAGIKHIVINVHHFADMVIDFIQQHHWDSTINISNERSLLLDTGGGLKHAAPLFSGKEDIVVHNVDILSDINLADVKHQHQQRHSLVTLCVSKRDTKRLLQFNEGGLLIGRASADHPLPTTHSILAFSGVSVVSPQLFHLLPNDDHPYPIIDEYIRLANDGYPIGSYVHPAEHWLDVGKLETLDIAKQWNLSSKQ